MFRASRRVWRRAHEIAHGRRLLRAEMRDFLAHYPITAFPYHTHATIRRDCGAAWFDRYILCHPHP